MLLYMYVSEWYSFNPHIVNILDCSTENNILELHVWLSKPMLASKQVQLRLTGMWWFVLHTNAVVSGELVKKNVQTLNEERLIELDKVHKKNTFNCHITSMSLSKSIYI